MSSAPNYTYDIDITGWGWIHLILGIVVLLGGIGLFYRKLWAGGAGDRLAMLSAIANFFFIPYYPFWSILMIALAVFVIWSITRPGAIAGRLRRRAGGRPPGVPRPAGVSPAPCA